MASDNQVTGRLIAPDLVQLTEPLSDVTKPVTVVVSPVLSAEDKNARLRELVGRLRLRPSGNRTRESIEAQIKAERDGWDDVR